MGFLDFIEESWDAVSGGVEDLAGSIWQGVGDSVDSITQGISDALDTVGGGIKDFAGGVKDTAKIVYSDLKEGLKNVASIPGSIGSSLSLPLLLLGGAAVLWMMQGQGGLLSGTAPRRRVGFAV